MHSKFNTYALLSMSQPEVEAFIVANPVPPILYITDSGHGWNTGGKRSKDGSLRENQFNSIVEAKISMICHLLRKKGLDITVIQLAPEHQDIHRNIRIKREHAIFEKYKDTHLILGHSIHADAYIQPSANGTTTFHYKGSKAVIFAQAMQNNLIEATGLRNRGVIDFKKFDLLKKTKSPFILTEAAFMTNPEELVLLKSDHFRDINAVASVDAVLEVAFVHYKEFISWELQ